MCDGLKKSWAVKSSKLISGFTFVVQKHCKVLVHIGLPEIGASNNHYITYMLITKQMLVLLCFALFHVVFILIGKSEIFS